MYGQNRYVPLGSGDAGGMGDVVFCKDLHLDRDVAIKFLRSGIEARRFVDEQLALMKLRSKHVVQLYDLIQVESKDGLVLEFIKGENLSDIDYSLLGGEVLISDLWQVSCGLADIHRHGIIHRDLKPNNIRKNENGVIKIFDFGLARSTHNAKTVGVVGTLAFMAPELWVGGATTFTAAVDVYAFSVMAIILAAQALPSELQFQPPKPYTSGSLKTLLSGVDPSIVDILERCISYNQSDRPTMDEVEACFRRYLLKGKHRGLIVINGKSQYIHKNNRSMVVGLQNKSASISINYDDYDFVVTNVVGGVKVNNQVAIVGSRLPKSSVITFETNSSERAFVTFDISNPEVVI